MDRKNIAVFGADGQLGYDVLQVLSSKDWVDFVLPVTYQDLDVEKDDVDAFLEEKIGENFSYIVNCVAYTNVDKAEDEKERAQRINADFPKKLAQFCSQNDIMLFHISTDYVFSGEKSLPYKETDVAFPLNVYGRTKLQGEEYVLRFCEKSFIFRTSGLFGRRGAWGKGGNFVTTMLKLAHEKDEIHVVSDQFTVPTHSFDVARAISHFIEKNINAFGVYHCCSSGGCSWYEFAVEIFSQMRIDVNVLPVSSKEFPTKALRPKYSVMDNSKLSVYYNMPYWKDALQEYILIKGFS